MCLTPRDLHDVEGATDKRATVRDRHAEVQSQLRDTDKWLRRKLRCYIWKQWGSKGYRMLRKAGVDRFLA